jgi:hypothetical protein
VIFATVLISDKIIAVNVAQIEMLRELNKKIPLEFEGYVAP